MIEEHIRKLVKQEVKSELERLFSGFGTTKTVTQPRVVKRTTRNVRIADRVTEILEDNSVKSVKDLARRVSANKQSVYATMSALVNMGKAVRVGKGLYKKVA